ncbi:hypothetical protein pclt_cds_1157 [Pandoravirus celtis]|uniref:Uncharacterized protein n=1 Tax=Pandoravirus celtis TaxID=2568002 RepID=A0A4D6EKX0_9VIRU|nr:hypothetical protein pclt_cds_1157 [Pandoravirus celtis]
MVYDFGLPIGPRHGSPGPPGRKEKQKRGGGLYNQRTRRKNKRPSLPGANDDCLAMMLSARCPWVATVRDLPHFRWGHAVSADPVPSGLAVIELHGLTCAEVASAPGQFAGIVKDLTATLAQDHGLIPLADGCDGAQLLSACIVGRRSRDGSGRLADDDACALLCVAALPAGSDSVWMAFTLAPYKRTDHRIHAPHAHIKAVDAFVTEAIFHDCFAQHATISGNGTIMRNSNDARDCASCARTWHGHRVLSRKSLRRGACGRVYSTAVHPSLLGRVTLGDIAVCGAQAIGDARSLGGEEEAVSHATRILGNLLVLIEDIIAACTWAKDHRVSRALSTVAKLDSTTGHILAGGLDGYTDTRRALQPMTAVLVAACSVARQIRTDVAQIILDETGVDIANQEVSTSFMDEWRTSRLAIKSTADALAFSERMISFLLALRDRGGAINPDLAAFTVETTSDQQQRQRARPEPKPATPLVEAVCLASDTLRCASAVCRVSGRRITSGCIVTACCTAGCRATFHRACWKAADIACADQTPCPTPDCWGEIVEVTSTRSRTSDVAPHLLWRACKHRDSPATSLSTPPLSPTPTTANNDADDDQVSVDSADSDDTGAPAQDDPMYRNNGHTVDDDQGHRRAEHTGHDNTTSASRYGPLASPATGGTPYHKVNMPGDGAPKRRKRRRARPSKPQRCRLARQESERLLALTGFVDTPASGTDKGWLEDTLPSGSAYADDALWPPFFVATGGTV